MKRDVAWPHAMTRTAGRMPFTPYAPRTISVNHGSIQQQKVEQLPRKNNAEIERRSAYRVCQPVLTMIKHCSEAAGAGAVDGDEKFIGNLVHEMRSVEYSSEILTPLQMWYLQSSLQSIYFPKGSAE
ncbi:hypothetical protein TELCIR_04816, partial [Teladorsagia circumcincta]